MIFSTDSCMIIIDAKKRRNSEDIWYDIFDMIYDIWHDLILKKRSALFEKTFEKTFSLTPFFIDTIFHFSHHAECQPHYNS